MNNIITILENEGYKCWYSSISLGFYFCNNGSKSYDDLPIIEIQIRTVSGKNEILQLPKEVYTVKGGLFGPDFMIGISAIDMQAPDGSGEYWILGD
jgi:hypothetical protein